MPTPVLKPAEAIRRIVKPGDRVLLGTAAGQAGTLETALVADRERLAGLSLIGGIQISDYPFMGPVRDGNWCYDTWQVARPIRDDVATGGVGFHPCRGALVPSLIRALKPDVFLTVVSPPDELGNVSFGASVSYALTMAREVGRVVAEINPAMPRTHGHPRVPLDSFDAIVESQAPLPTYRGPAPEPITQKIAENVRGLLVEGATLQIGLGSIPETLVAILGQDPPPGLRLFGMGVDGMVPFLEATMQRGTFVGGELLGSARLYDFAHENSVIETRPISPFLGVPALARIPRFISLNSAIEIDLSGQVNSEWVDGIQVSAPGAAFDFVDGTWFSEGGRSIIALRSTAGDGGISTIVPRLGEGTPVSIPRHSVRYVVTEFGVADLLGLNAMMRREALIELAHPDFRQDLDATSVGGMAGS